MPARRTRAKPAPAKALRPQGSALVIPERAEADQPSDGALIQHPDGWYWVAADGDQEFGPFGSRAEAIADRDRGDESGLSEGESLAEAEDELGQAGWIDPDTGLLAEGQSTPHIEDH